MLYAFDGREPEIGRDVYISDQGVVIGEVRMGDGCYVGPELKKNRRAHLREKYLIKRIGIL